MLMIALGMLAITILISVGEAYYERDWPRDTIKFVVMALALVVMCLH